jgi:hypothetical protein
MRKVAQSSVITDGDLDVAALTIGLQTYGSGIGGEGADRLAAAALYLDEAVTV